VNKITTHPPFTSIRDTISKYMATFIPLVCVNRSTIHAILIFVSAVQKINGNITSPENLYATAISCHFK
jgi:hypothetical protein